MAPSYLKICEKVLHQKQLADKKNYLLFKKINMLERKVIELEAMKSKYETLARDNLYLELELRELKKSRDAIFMTCLEQKTKIELCNQVLALMSQVSALEKTNMELWIDKRKLTRELNALKPSPLSIICGSKEYDNHPDDLEVQDGLNRGLGNGLNSACDSADNSLILDDALKLLQRVEQRESTPLVKDSQSCFHTPVKRRFSSTLLSDEITWLPTPPIAVIPPWCTPPVEEAASQRSMVVSTIFSNCVDPAPSAIDINCSFSTATSYRKIEISRPKSMPVLSTKFEQFDYDNVPESTIDNSVDENSVHLSILDEEISDFC